MTSSTIFLPSQPPANTKPGSSNPTGPNALHRPPPLLLIPFLIVILIPLLRSNPEPVEGCPACPEPVEGHPSDLSPSYLSPLASNLLRSNPELVEGCAATLSLSKGTVRPLPLLPLALASNLLRSNPELVEGCPATLSLSKGHRPTPSPPLTSRLSPLTSCAATLSLSKGTTRPTSHPPSYLSPLASNLLRSNPKPVEGHPSDLSPSYLSPLASNLSPPHPPPPKLFAGCLASAFSQLSAIMSTLTAKIEQQLMDLPALDRVRLADKLLSSLDVASNRNFDAEWAQEAESRIQAYAAGQLSSSPASAVFDRLSKKYGS
jgi:putative addiction module component (TIGR02574 family)